MNLREFLSVPDHVKRLYGALPDPEYHFGFVFLEVGEGLQSQVVLHLRECLKVGYHLEMDGIAHGVHRELSPENGYAVVLVYPPDHPGTHPPRAGLEVNELRDRGLTLMRLFLAAADRGHTVQVFGEARAPYWPTPRPLKIRPVPFDIGRLESGSRPSHTVYLPFKIVARAAGLPAGFWIKPQRHLVSQPRWIEVDGSDSEHIEFRLDGVFGTDGRSDLVVRGLKGVSYSESTPEPVPDGPRYHAGPLTLHLLFDRTVLDPGSWRAAYESLVHPVRLDPAIPSPFEEPPADAILPQPEFNLQLRTALDNGLERAVKRFHRDCEVQLYWFADTPREGIARADSLSMSDRAWGRAGRWFPGFLPQPGEFGYVYGADLFDAVDEALMGVTEQVARERGRYHAVLVVGNSPPPPSSTGDMLWNKLVDTPVRSNARISPRFDTALRRLHQDNIAVGWLFVEPEKPENLRGSMELGLAFDRYRDLTLRVRDCLTSFKGLHFEQTNLAGLGDALARLLGRMRWVRAVEPMIVVKVEQL